MRTSERMRAAGRAMLDLRRLHIMGERTGHVLVGLAVVCMGSGVVWSQSVPPGGWHDDAINGALQDRHYNEAVTLIDERLRALHGRESDAALDQEREYLLYRRGLARLYSAQYAPAIETFRRQLDRYPDGRWRAKARFRLAESHVQRGEHRAAEAIYAEEVRRLVGPARKDRLAQVYVAFADDFFSPKDRFTKPDYEKARTFYSRALEVGLSDPGRDTVRFNRASATERLGKFGEAAREYQAYLVLFDPSYRQRQLGRPGSPSLPEPAAQPGRRRLDAHVRLAECLLRLGRFSDARRMRILW